MANIKADHVEEISDRTRTTSHVKGDGIDDDGHYENAFSEKKYSHIAHPEPWPFENWIPGGYSQSRMLRFKNPSTMYKVINLFAGEEFVQVFFSLKVLTRLDARLCDLLLRV